MTRWQVLVPMVVVVFSGAAARAQDAQDRPPPAAEFGVGWAGFVDDATIHHGVLGGSLRWHLSPRVSIGPELVYMKGPGQDRDFFATGNLTFDFWRASSARPVTPYLVAGAGFMRHTGGVGTGTYTSGEGAFTAGPGIRVRLSDRAYVGAEWRAGWELHSRLTAVFGFNLR